MARLIDADRFLRDTRFQPGVYPHKTLKLEIEEQPTVVAYTAHDVAEILADVFGDACACNFNGYDEWLPEKCELLDACPYPVVVACWEQFLKFRDAKNGGDGNG